MKVTYQRIAEDDGFSEGLLIKGETEFEKEWLMRHGFPKMYTGETVITDRMDEKPGAKGTV